MVEGYDSLLLFVAYETAVAVVWFAAGPAQAMRTTVTEVLESFL